MQQFLGADLEGASFVVRRVLRDCGMEKVFLILYMRFISRL